MHMEAWCICQKPNPIVSIHNVCHSQENVRASSSRAHISPIPETPPQTSVTILPSVNFMLEGDDFSPTPSPDRHNDNNDISPFFIPHLRWKEKYFSSSSDFPVEVDSLIDNACPYVLI